MKRTQIMLILLICFICVFQVQLFGAETNAESAGQKAFLKNRLWKKTIPFPQDRLQAGRVSRSEPIRRRRSFLHRPMP